MRILCCRQSYSVNFKLYYDFRQRGKRVLSGIMSNVRAYRAKKLTAYCIYCRLEVGDYLGVTGQVWEDDVQFEEKTRDKITRRQMTAGTLIITKMWMTRVVRSSIGRTVLFSANCYVFFHSRYLSLLFTSRDFYFFVRRIFSNLLNEFEERQRLRSNIHCQYWKYAVYYTEKNVYI